MTKAQEALDRLRGELNDNELDALVASSPHNVCYAAGTYFTTMKTVPERTAYVVVTGDDEPTFVFCTIEEGHAREESWLTDFVGYTEFADEPALVLARVLRRCGGRARIGVETRNLSARDHELLRAALPDAEFVPADRVFDRVRAVKTAEEIEILGKAAYLTDTAIRTAFETTVLGDSGTKIADTMIAAARAAGAEKLLHQTLAVGSDGFKVHAAANHRTLSDGDVLRTDFGMSWPGHYLSDVARTAFASRVSTAQRTLYTKLEDVQRQLVEAIRPGVLAKDVFARGTALFRAAGVTFEFPHVGHSIGLGLHENPMLHPFDDTVLLPGMVFMVEPLVRGTDGIYHVEDMVLVTDTGSEVLSRSADWTSPMVVG